MNSEDKIAEEKEEDEEETKMLGICLINISKLK